MLNINLRPLKPLMRTNHPPNHCPQHRRPPDQTSPIHQTRIEILPPYSWQTQDRNHQAREARRQRPDDGARTTQMPGSTMESITDEERADGDGNRESDEGGDSRNGEDGADGDFAGEYEKGQTDADGCVEPDGVDRGLSVLVDSFPVLGERKAIISGVGVRDTGRSDHAALAHAEAADDG